MLAKEKNGHIYGEVIHRSMFRQCDNKIQKRLAEKKKSEMISEVCAISKNPSF